MGLAQGAAQAVGVLGHHDQVDVIGHQAVCPDRGPAGGAERRHQGHLVRLGGGAEEGLLFAGYRVG